MNDNGQACKDCKAHSAVKVRVDHLENSDAKQWRDIDSMKNYLIATLTSSVLSLIAIVGMVLAKLAGAM